MTMELSSLLHDLHLSASEKRLPSPPLPPITELLSRLREKLIGSSSDSESSSLIGRVERLFQTADPDWLFSPASTNEEEEEEEWAGLGSAYRSLVDALIGRAAVPPCEDDVGAAPAAAYQSVPSRAVPACTALTALLVAMGNPERRRRGRGLLLTVAPPLCVFAVTHFQERPWTNSASRAAARRLQEELLRAGGWTDSSHLLLGGRSQGGEEEEEQKEQEEEEQEERGRSRGILGGVLDVLQPQLTRDSWRRREPVKLVFVWTLLQVTRPSLSPHLPRLLPPSLLLSDDYRPENCMMGVRCLHHIVLNTPAAELRQFNRAEVLYQALFKHLYTTEAAVIQLVLSCLLDLLLVLEKPPSSSSSSSSPRKPCRHDDVLRLVLTHMEAEHKVALRRVYACALPPLVDRMGVAVCRHLRRLERVLQSYLELSDSPEETSRLKMLEVLEKTTRAAWPRWERRRGEPWLRLLLRLLLVAVDDAEMEASVRLQLLRRTGTCVQLLDVCSHHALQPLLRQLDSSCCSPEVLRCLETVTTAAER